ncbi:MAG: NAD-dependent epimerase/dehydratase family protein [Gemmatimonadetes bacterium]|nr:NAD-dependent epimerase/dehydratase family protein [Gemmatimonadota bacterium]
MSILVTGAAGFIGSHTCEALLEGGERVVGLDNFDDFYAPEVKERHLAGAREHEGFTLVRGDIRDPGALDALPDHVEAVVHLAARAGVRPSIEHPELYADVNIMGTVRLLAWAKKRGVRRFVFASSSSVYGNNEKVPFSESDRVDHPISPYAATKKAGELVCHAASHLDGIATACLRFFTVYGPRQRPDLAVHKFARILRDGGAIPMFGDGTTSRDYTYIDDTVSGVIGALEWVSRHEGAYRIFNLGNHRTVALTEMIRTIGEEMGVEPRIEQLPMQPGDVARTYADIERARDELGYSPETAFRDGVRRFLQWFSQQPG